MTVSRLLERPEADYADVPQAYKNIKLSLSKWERNIAYTPQMRENAEFWNNTGLIIPDSSMNDITDETKRLIKYEYSCIFEGTGVLAAGEENGLSPSNYIPVANWNQSNRDRFTSWMRLYRKYRYFYHSFSEYYDGGLNINTFTNPDQCYEIDKSLGLMLKETSGVNFGDYAGHLYIRLDNDADPGNTNLEDAMLNNAVALRQVSRGGLFNHRNTPAWDTAAQNNGKRNLFNYCGVCYQVYVIFSPIDGNVTKEFIKSLCNYVVGDNALQQLLELGEIPVKPPSTTFGWKSVTQPGGDFFGIGRRKITSQGTIISDDFPNYAISMMESIELYGLIYNKFTFNWNDNLYYSLREDHPPVDAGTPGSGLRSFIPFAGFENVTRYGVQVRKYTNNELDSHYVPSAKGGEDVPFYIGLMYQQMCDYVDTNAFVNGGIRKVGSINAYQTTGKNAPLVAYRTKNAICRYIYKGTRACVVITPCGPFPSHYDVQIGNNVWSTSSVKDSTNVAIPELIEGVTYCFAIDFSI